MFGLRKISLLLIPILFSGKALAFSQKLSSEFEVKNTRQPLGVFGIERSSKVKNQNLQLGYEAEGIKKYYYSSLFFTANDPDYTDLKIVNEEGNEEPLTGTSALETKVSATFGIQKNTHNFNIGINSFIDDAPYKDKGISFTFEESFYNRTTIFGLNASFTKYYRPTSYYLAQDYQLIKRPSEVNGNTSSIYLIQALSDRIKIRVDAVTAQRIEERPRNIGLKIKSGFVLSDILYGKLSAGHIRELKSMDLKNDRGYFQVTESEAELIFEPVFDLLLAFSYQLAIEREDNPGTGEILQVGTDSFGLGANYLMGKTELYSKMLYSKTNSKTEDVVFNMGMSWEI